MAVLLPASNYIVFSCLANSCEKDNNKAIPLKVSTIWDGWSTRKRQPFTSFSISFIDSPADNDTLWKLKNYLLEFNSPVGRHTGELIGMDLVNTTRKFRLEKKVGIKEFVITEYI